MAYMYITKKDLASWVDTLSRDNALYAPVAKGPRFAFDKVDGFKNIRLDYDTTILPPKKLIFPQIQTLLKFSGNAVNEENTPQPKILFGVHPYDIVAISQLDILFKDGRPDYYWIANREACAIIGSNVVRHYKTAFFGSMNAGQPEQGFDIFLTDIGGGYVANVATDKGAALIAKGSFVDAKPAQTAKADAVNKRAAERCPQKIQRPTSMTPQAAAQAVSDKVVASFNSPIWEELSERCFSCGSCNLICPTCYCFDVQDEWRIDGQSGERYRRWDGCLTREFAEVAVQGGQHNFRKERAERYRHRIMRKVVYLNKKLNGPACVGCGRCVTACTANIANPVEAIRKIMEAKA